MTQSDELKLVRHLARKFPKGLLYSEICAHAEEAGLPITRALAEARNSELVRRGAYWLPRKRVDRPDLTPMKENA